MDVGDGGGGFAGDDGETVVVDETGHRETFQAVDGDSVFEFSGGRL